MNDSRGAAQAVEAAFVELSVTACVPTTGLTSVGASENTILFVPVLSVNIAAAFALEGVVRNVETPEPNEVVPVPPKDEGNTPA